MQPKQLEKRKSRLNTLQSDFYLDTSVANVIFRDKNRRIFPLPSPKDAGTDSIFLISDTHFNQYKIIEKNKRPFSSVVEMNRTLTENWNRAVPPGGRVYFLGDFGFGDWIQLLNGRIRFIAGNHDDNIDALPYRIESFGGRKFTLVHHPARRFLPVHTDGWLIHGHIHNYDLVNYPFINGRQKTINVSVELINYTPLSVSYLLSLNLEHIYYMKDIDSVPQYW